MQPSRRGFTLIELLVVVALIGIVMVIAAPSFRDYILMQRLKGINAQLVTDLQFARSEAVARNQAVSIRFSSNNSLTCYTLFTGDTNACNCLSSPTCLNTGVEVRTVQISKDLGSLVLPGPNNGGAYEFQYSSVTGGMKITATDGRGLYPPNFEIEAHIDTPRKLRTVVSRTGRPSVCKPPGSTMNEPLC